MSSDDQSEDNSNESAEDDDDIDSANEDLSDDPAQCSDSEIEIDDVIFHATGELALVAPSSKKPSSASTPCNPRVSLQLPPDPPVDDNDNDEGDDDSKH